AAIFTAICAADPAEDLIGVLCTDTIDPVRVKLGRLLTAIRQEDPSWTGTAQVFQVWCPRLARYSFHTRDLTGPTQGQPSTFRRGPQSQVLVRSTEGMASRVRLTDSRSTNGDPTVTGHGVGREARLDGRAGGARSAAADREDPAFQRQRVQPGPAQPEPQRPHPPVRLRHRGGDAGGLTRAGPVLLRPCSARRREPAGGR